MSKDPNAVGDNGAAIGCLQITERFVDDVNRIQTEVRFSYADRLNVDRSILMARVYLDHYATEERISHEPTIQDAARIFNGGPRGWKKRSTINYWRKVEKVLRAGGRK